VSQIILFFICKHLFDLNSFILSCPQTYFDQVKIRSKNINSYVISFKMLSVKYCRSNEPEPKFWHPSAVTKPLHLVAALLPTLHGCNAIFTHTIAFHHMIHAHCLIYPLYTLYSAPHTIKRCIHTKMEGKKKKLKFFLSIFSETPSKKGFSKLSRNFCWNWEILEPQNW
jgi:hypothetical protein